MATEASRLRALILEDEPAIRELLRFHLDLQGFALEEVADGRLALTRTQQVAFDLILLDVMLPGLDGVGVCCAVRAGGPNAATPILMLTARDGESDKVLGLESGADDYLTKPFGVRELLARVGAIMRRHRRGGVIDPPPADRVLRAGPLALDPDRRTLTIGQAAVDLTKQEFDLLYLLASRRGIVFSRAALLHQIWPGDTYVTERTVDAVISRLRKKVEADSRDPALLLTAWASATSSPTWISEPA